jgi:hypothetical protein
MKFFMLLLICLLAGCASSSDYVTYIDAQKSMNRDLTVSETARVAALIEIVKTTDDVSVKVEAIRALQQIQRGKRPIIIEQRKSGF